MAKKITQNVNKDKLFNDLPNVHPQYSKWKTRFSNYQASNLGEIVPIYYDELLPGERRMVTMGMISHMETPIAPIFNAGYTEFRSFVVPLRLCADLLNGYSTRKSPWVKVFGEDNKSTSSDIIVNLADQTLPDISTQAASNFSASMSGLTASDNVFDSLDVKHLNNTKDANYLQLAAYELIYQRHYRNENYESSTESDLYKLLYNAYNTTSSFTLPSSFTFEKANREKDYFTGAKPFTLKANSPVEVGLSGEAKLKTGTLYDLDRTKPVLFGSYGNSLSDGYHPVEALSNEGSNGKGYATIRSTADSSATDPEPALNQWNIYADLSTASGISIEDLRLLIKTQELLEKDAIYGSRYAESLNAHFGTCPIDLTLQEPQELFKTTITSNVQAIFQTSSTSGEASILGTIGANSTTQTDSFVIVPEFEAKEHCILMICAVHKLQNVYDSRYFKPKFIYKKARFDFYTPELNDLGYQPVSNKEMRSSSNATAGFNEAFAEYRFKFNKSHGSLNTTTYKYWAPAIANEYTSVAAMYKEAPTILDKALSVASTTAPQFFDAYGFEEVNTKPMSLHSIPGFDGVI